MEKQLSHTTTKQLFSGKSVQEKFQKLLGKKAPGFISSVLQTVNSNKLLKNAEPHTVLNAAATAAILDLPINQNLGFAWIVPYKGQAQFQMGWKGYVQLALRTGQYLRINVTEVYSNQFTSFNRLTEELIADFNIEGKENIVGYAAYFKLSNGMEKTSYWTKEKVIRHAKKYSQAYNSSFSPWQDKDQFDAMAKKTVLKNTLSRWGIMSIELQTAQLVDQSVQEKEGDYNYIDNPQIIDIKTESLKEENTRIYDFINKAETIEQINEIRDSLDSDQLLKYDSKLTSKETEILHLEATKN
ncbi:recombinase RecT [Aquimarina hainanensis]|uniref:Recombinase RecT n=1 Tax=Aquimarina hainanensis TaxID=1578017 RepID=A0ABW5NBA3_9FLAO